MTSESLKTNENIIESIVSAMGVTNQQLADELGITRARVENWRYKGVTIPAAYLHGIIRLLLDRINGAARIQEIAARAVHRAGETRKPRRNPPEVTP